MYKIQEFFFEKRNSLNYWIFEAHIWLSLYFFENLIEFFLRWFFFRNGILMQHTCLHWCHSMSRSMCGCLWRGKPGRPSTSGKGWQIRKPTCDRQEGRWLSSFGKTACKNVKKNTIRNYKVYRVYVNLNCCLIQCHLTWFKVLSVGMIRVSFTFGIWKK